MKLGQNGMTLTSVLIAIALAGGLAIFMTKIHQQGLKSAKGLQATSEVDELHLRVLNFLKDQGNCDLTFGGKIAGTNNITLKRMDIHGTEDNTFKGLSTESNPIRLADITILDPKAENTNSKIPVVPSTPSKNGREFVIRFTYDKYVPANGEAPKIFGATSVAKYTVVKFFNFMPFGGVDGFFVKEEDCKSSPDDIPMQQKTVVFEDGTQTTMFRCMNTSVVNPIITCVL